MQPAVQKWIKWVLVLLLARVNRPFAWASFLALNPLIKKIVRAHMEQRKVDLKPRDVQGNEVMNSEIDRSLNPISCFSANTISNFITCALLYYASVRSALPKDYFALYHVSSYYTELNPPSSSEIGPGVAPLFQISKVSDRLAQLYNNKHFVIYPAIFAQILSNYLTPTQLKLNHKYLSAPIKRYCLNPVWMNFQMTRTTVRINAARIFGNYVLANGVLGVAVALACFKDRFLDEHYRAKFGLTAQSARDVAISYTRYVVRKANGIANMIYIPSLLSMLLIGLTSNVVAPNSKFLLKTYIKSVGFVSAFIAVCLNATTTEEPLSSDFYNKVNIYLFRLLVLSKWRITKGNHPWFTKWSLRTWESIETTVMCYGMLRILNLTDYIAANQEFVRLQRLAGHPLVRAAANIEGYR